MFSLSSEKVSVRNSGAGATTIATDGGSQNSIEAATINVAGDHNTIVNGSKIKEGPKKSEEVYDYAAAQYYLGLAYQDGRGIAFSDSKAVQAWLEAAIHGNADAQFLLGRAYEFGRGVQASQTEALKWYKMAANQGNADAMNSVGNFYKGDKKSIQKDSKEAIRWYEEAIKRNNINAMYNLAQMYYSGDGIARNRRKALCVAAVGTVAPSGATRYLRPPNRLGLSGRNISIVSGCAGGSRCPLVWPFMGAVFCKRFSLILSLFVSC
ncbi:MAG: tetratricopeptide repeat protein [Bdellovibrionales bacterium]